MVEGDSVRLRQLVMILVDNAIRHSPAGGEVRVAVRTDGDAALLDVEDQGRGVRPEDMPHLFDRFWRASGAPSRRDGPRAGDREMDRRPAPRHDHGLEPGRGRRPVPGPAAVARARIGVRRRRRRRRSPAFRRSMRQSISDGSHVGPLESGLRRRIRRPETTTRRPLVTAPRPAAVPPTDLAEPRRRRWPIDRHPPRGRAPRRRLDGVLVPVPAARTPAPVGLVGASASPAATAVASSAPAASADPSPAPSGDRGVERRLDRRRPRRHVERRPVGRLVLGLLGLVRRLPGRGGARERRRRDRGRPDARRDRQPDVRRLDRQRGGLHGQPRHAPERPLPARRPAPPPGARDRHLPDRDVQAHEADRPRRRSRPTARSSRPRRPAT